MPTTTPFPISPATRPTKKATVGSLGRRRRSVPHLVAGALLVSCCTAAGAWWSVTAGERQPALALAHPMTVGDVLAAGDLREVSIAVDGGVDAIPATEASAIVGKRLAVSLPAGVLLPRGALGAAPTPPQGRAVAALALQPGQAPPDVGPGVSVVVVIAADQTSGTDANATWPGLVTDVATQDNGERVVSVELDDGDAREVAAAPTGRLSLVVVPEGGR